jgi:5-deoxy-glucuronate isomerase
MDQEVSMSTAAQVDIGKMIFRKTNAHSGRHIAVNPSNSAMKHLAYGRIILDSASGSNGAKSAVSFSTGNRETGLIVLSGEAAVKVGDSETQLGKYDAMYVPRDSSIEIKTNSNVDIAEFSSDVEKHYPLQVVRYAEISRDPGLKFDTGSTACTRHLNMLLAKNVEAGRLLVGITSSDAGNWTSWPPHEHAKMLEELYVYFDMPEPAFGIQLVYNNTQQPELVTVVRDGDAVLMPSGYHPNVSVPGHRICFLWAMAAHREVDDRQFGVVTVQPGFETTRTGLEAGRKQ